MEKLITRKEAAEILGISIATLDAARNNGLISYVYRFENRSVCLPDMSAVAPKCFFPVGPALLFLLASGDIA